MSVKVFDFLYHDIIIATTNILGKFNNEFLAEGK